MADFYHQKHFNLFCFSLLPFIVVSLRKEWQKKFRSQPKDQESLDDTGELLENLTKYWG